MEVKKIVVKTWTIGSGSRTARSRSKEDKRYAVPRGSQFFKYGLGILRKGEYLAFPAAKFMYAVAFMCRVSD
ncbi:hypothetical protein T4C_3752 [Trichinella pseudospiralis]|uniref:Uncharacterized protein n=1 Tax=Trichinella pseudospiralis TaxID=6337 RepID=A0A0V1HT21_TRIPS|nr:hypothetical protein T4C_3752 [Trichinella pseudospiralis]